MSFSSYFNNNVYSSWKKKPANVLTEKKREARARAVVVAGARGWQLSLILESAVRAGVEKG